MGINDENIKKMTSDKKIQSLPKLWHDATLPYNYVYNFTWMGIPIIQNPQDIIAWQELVMRIKPDLIIETGIAHGGSVLLSASLLHILEMEDGVRSEVIGIDIDIRPNTYEELRKHPELYYCYMTLIESSSIKPETIEIVRRIATTKHNVVMVTLDSNHTHDHVLAELEAYAPLVTPGSYIIVNDTGMEYFDLPHPETRPWGPGNSPMSAVKEFLKTHPEFEQDFGIDNKLIITSSPGGWLRRKDDE